MGVAFVIFGLVVVAGVFFALWLIARNARQEAEREAARQLVEADEARSRATDAERHKANLFKRVLELEVNAERAVAKIAELYKRVEATDATHASRVGNLVAELKAARHALEAEKRKAAEAVAILGAA